MIPNINIDTLKLVLYGVALVVFLSLGASWYVRGVNIDKLNNQVTELKLEVSTANSRIAQAQNAARVASERLDALRLEESEINRAVRQAREREGNSDEINNAVRDAINSINRMRGTESGSGSSGNPR